LLEKCYGTLPMHVLATTVRFIGYTSLLSCSFLWFAELT
jgi:hypothetical protein